MAGAVPGVSTRQSGFSEDLPPGAYPPDPAGGTGGAWLDCSGLKLSYRELNDLIVNRAWLWLDAGHIFGQDAGQFQRIVLVCPRATLEQAVAEESQPIKQ